MARGRYGTGTTFAELLLGTRRSIVRAGSGAVSVDAADPSAPPAISNLQLTSTSVLDNYQGTYVSIVKATWDPVVPDVSEDADVDVSPVTDYLCSYAYADEGWSREGGTGGVNAFTTHAVPTGVEVTVRVRARRRSGAVGPYTTATIVTSRDETPPPRPSAPTVIGTVRGVSVGWDGLFVQPDGSGSAPRPPDFAYVIAEVATQPDFSDIVKGGVLSERGQTAVTRLTDGTPFTAYARLVAVDHSGNRSVLSAVTQGGSIRVIDKDVGESAITTAKLAEAAVTAEKILNGAIDTFKLSDGAVTGLKLADLSVTVGKVVNGAIESSKLADLAVLPAKLAEAAVETSKIAGGAVVAEKIAAESIYAHHIVSEQIHAGHIVAGSISGDRIAGNTITGNEIAANSIIAWHIVAGEITSEKIAAYSIVADKMAALAVSTGALQANAVTTDKIEANSISSGQIAAGAITADELAATAVTGKVVTGGVIRTGVAGEDRLEMRDETVYDPALGYNRSIRDTIRWLRGYDGAIVAEVRGYMGDIGAYGLHLNADVELGNTQSVIYQVGKRAALAPDVDVRLRKGKWTGFTKNGDGTVDVEFGSAMSQPPTGISLTLGYDTASGNAVTQIVEREVYASHIHAKVRYADGSVPGDGTKVTVYYGAEIVV